MSDYLKSPRRLSKTPDSIVRIKPVVIGESDRAAGKLIEYLVNDLLPEDATIGDAEDAILSALWWLHTWASNDKASKYDNATD